MKEIKCPKCGSVMSDDGMMVCSNTKYKNWKCDVCDHKETRVMGFQHGV